MQDSIDINLWNDFLTGDKRAVYGVYKFYYDDLFRYGLKVTGDENLCKELINGLFFDLWRRQGKLSDIQNPKAYIITSFRNKILQHRREKQPSLIFKGEDALFDSDFPTASAEENVIKSQEYQQLQRKVENILSSLTERQQQLIKLRFIEELSYEEIAQSLNISIRTVYNTIHESMKILRNQYTENSDR